MSAQESDSYDNDSSQGEDLGDLTELEALNKLQAEQEVGFEKEGFDDDDFSGEEEDEEREEGWGREYKGEGELPMLGAELDGKAINLCLDMKINIDETLAETDTQLLNMKIQKNLMVLADYASQKEEGVQRQDYVDELMDLFCKLYGYNAELMQLLMDLFGPHEVPKFILTEVPGFLGSYGRGETSNYQDKHPKVKEEGSCLGPDDEKDQP